VKLLDRLNRLLGGSNADPTVALYCPLQDGTDEETRIATEETEPDAWLQEDRIAVYSSPVCEKRHRFLWGPPAPLYLGDCPNGVEEGSA
jgi:hypothetical protein